MEQNITKDILKFDGMLDVNSFLNVNTDTKTAPIAPQLQLLSIQDVCRRLNVGYWMVYKLIGENKLRSITIGKRRLIPVQALQDFFNQSEGFING